MFPRLAALVLAAGLLLPSAALLTVAIVVAAPPCAASSSIGEGSPTAVRTPGGASPAASPSDATAAPGTSACPPHPLPPAAIDVAAAAGAGRLPDPTGTGGFVTRRTAHLIAQTRAAFPDTGWACWSARPGTRSEHPLGRACDVTFGNPIGTAASTAQRAHGWAMTVWLQDHAETLGVQYLIWQGRIWSLARAGEGWRPYGGGGMHNPASITGGHYDHLHLTVIG